MKTQRISITTLLIIFFVILVGCTPKPINQNKKSEDTGKQSSRYFDIKDDTKKLEEEIKKIEQQIKELQEKLKTDFYLYPDEKASIQNHLKALYELKEILEESLKYRFPDN